MTWELQPTLEASGIEWPALRNHIPCMAHVIQLALGAFMSSLGVKGCTKSWEAHQCDQQFGANESTDIGKSQRLRKEVNDRINKVSAMKPGWSKIIENVRIWRIFKSTETDICTAANACGIDYADTWSSKRVHLLSKSQSTNRRTTYYGCENRVEFNCRVAWVSLPITRIHPWVAHESKIQRIQATLHNTRWMDNHQVHHGSLKAIPILDPVDVETAYSSSASRHRGIQCHVRSYAWRYGSFGEAEDQMERRLIFRRKVCATEAVQILFWHYSNNRPSSYFSTCPWSFPEAAIN